MTHPAIQEWFYSGKYAKVNGSRVRLIPHPFCIDEPLSMQKGQALAIYLLADDGGKWILKKFDHGKSLDRNYLVSVTSLLPSEDGFIAGTQRQILSSDKLTRTAHCFYTTELATFLNGTILMPKVTGTYWSGLADELREGKLEISKPDRVTLCRNLAILVAALENNRCCHRDLCSGNIFIDKGSWKIYFIDFDSLYHPSLIIPDATKCGTDGYVPPYAWRGDILDATQTWCPYADRYAMGLLIIEFCILTKGSPLTGDGGMFNQDELRHRYGPGLNAVREELRHSWSRLSQLFERLITSKDFNSCPSPQDWQKALNFCVMEPVSLAQFESIPIDYFQQVLKKTHRQPAKVWTPPKLSEFPEFKIERKKKRLENYFITSKSVDLKENRL
jgi:serine/threonine protein kinase